MTSGQRGGGHCYWRGRVKREGERLKVPLEMPDDAGLQTDSEGGASRKSRGKVEWIYVDARTRTRTAQQRPFCRFAPRSESAFHQNHATAASLLLSCPVTSSLKDMR